MVVVEFMSYVRAERTSDSSTAMCLGLGVLLFFDQNYVKRRMIFERNCGIFSRCHPRFSGAIASSATIRHNMVHRHSDNKTHHHHNNIIIIMGILRESSQFKLNKEKYSQLRIVHNHSFVKYYTNTHKVIIKKYITSFECNI